MTGGGRVSHLCVMSVPKARRGVLVSIEGIDGSGKTSLVLGLIRELCDRGKDVRVVTHPSRVGPVSEVLSRYLEKRCEIPATAAHLLFLADMHAKASEVERLVEGGTVVLMDRYVWSAMVYSLERLVSSPVSLSWLETPSVGLPRPDLTLLLSVPPSVAVERVLSRGASVSRDDGLKSQTQLAARFESMAATTTDGSWVRLDATQSRMEVKLEALCHIEKAANRVGNMPLARLCAGWCKV